MSARRPVVLAAALAFALVGCGRTGGEAEGFRPLAIGEAVPTYDVVTLGGDSVRVGGGDTSLTLLNVWATWCVSCREEFADLEAIARDYAAHGVRVIAVSVDRSSVGRIERFVAEQGTTFPVAHDPDARIQRLYQTVGVPETYLVSSDGALLWRHTGGLAGKSAIARTAIDRALGDSTRMVAARDD